MNSKRRRQQAAMKRLSNSRSRSRSRAAEVTFERKDDGRLLEPATNSGSFVRGAVVHLWGSGL